MKRDSVSAYVHSRCGDTPLPLYAPVHILDDSPSILPVAYVLNDSLFLNQEANMNIRMSYLLKYKHLKEKLFTKK